MIYSSAQLLKRVLTSHTCCAYLDTENLKQLPKGLDGVTSIFEFYLTAVANKVEKQLRLIPQLSIPRKSLDHFLNQSAALGDGGSLPLEVAIELFEKFHNSGGYTDQSLFTAFLSEGVLTQDME